MNTLPLILLCLLSHGLTAALRAAPSAERIIDRWIEAVGGRAALGKIQSREAKGSIDLTAVGLRADLVYLGQAPNQRLIEFTLGEFGKGGEGYDGQTAWAATPGGPVSTRSGTELTRARREAVFHQELNFTRLYPELAVLGTATVGDRETWIVQARTPEGVEELHYFDQADGLLRRKDLHMDSPQGRVAIEILLEDYREIDGVKIAHTIRLQKPVTLAMVMRFNEVRHNHRIPDDRFKPPAR